MYGKGPATKYSLTPQAQVTMPLDIDTYFKNEMDDRTVQENFNFELNKTDSAKGFTFHRRGM